MLAPSRSDLGSSTEQLPFNLLQDPEVAQNSPGSSQVFLSVAKESGLFLCSLLGSSDHIFFPSLNLLSLTTQDMRWVKDRCWGRQFLFSHFCPRLFMSGAKNIWLFSLFSILCHFDCLEQQWCVRTSLVGNISLIQSLKPAGRRNINHYQRRLFWSWC